MATKNHTVSNQSDFGDPMSLENRLESLACDAAGIESVLTMMATSDACDANSDACKGLFLLSKVACRIHDELNEIAVLTRPDRKDDPANATEDASHD